MSYLAQYMGDIEANPAEDLSAVEILCRPYGTIFYHRVVAYLRSSSPVPPDEYFSSSELEVVRALLRMSGTFLLDPIGLRLNTPHDVVRVMAALKYRNVETQVVIALDCARRILGTKELSIGSSSNCSFLVHTLWNFLASVDASGFYIVHNHPDGQATPSQIDIDSAVYLHKAGPAIGFRFKDSIIVTRGEFSSVKELHPELFTPTQPINVQAASK